MIVSVEAVGALLGVVLVGLFVFGLRRRLIQRPGGTFDCSLRAAPAEGAEPGGKGWVYGVARYSGDQVEWFRVFSYAPRPRRVLDRPAIEVLGRREAQGSEELALLSDAVVLSCVHRGARLELAMSDDALTGFLAWLEAAPPGQRVNVA
ncbi:DUF2550 domain-containing protein [Streptomyces sp. V4-01]|uniref:DUF2550 domain-containing protein n=1 Tax=Actinacidiphila polyblastidii TaxID=3110430 RepID=A0ABU7P4F5_9ACTN|nr:DUF2550 domain-containing protein [Streptomyces sp. V4-01]